MSVGLQELGLELHHLLTVVAGLWGRMYQRPGGEVAKAGLMAKSGPCVSEPWFGHEGDYTGELKKEKLKVQKKKEKGSTECGLTNFELHVSPLRTGRRVLIACCPPQVIAAAVTVGAFSLG
ncbi:Hypothetical predicted protein [Pelobates cultripes]|uniref:Uncharacterized protein n=1 Tax=Pelobates cultripes TaxID=61616 RepID=A0AAD1R2K9_PELCU|nr:Hypothetical predicted protein [Pelobates cultripes]